MTEENEPREKPSSSRFLIVGFGFVFLVFVALGLSWPRIDLALKLNDFRKQHGKIYFDSANLKAAQFGAMRVLVAQKPPGKFGPGGIGLICLTPRVMGWNSIQRVIQGRGLLGVETVTLEEISNESERMLKFTFQRDSASKQPARLAFIKLTLKQGRVDKFELIETEAK